jgi:hypothetical protein
MEANGSSGGSPSDGSNGRAKKKQKQHAGDGAVVEKGEEQKNELNAALAKMPVVAILRGVQHTEVGGDWVGVVIGWVW